SWSVDSSDARGIRLRQTSGADGCFYGKTRQSRRERGPRAGERAAAGPARQPVGGDFSGRHRRTGDVVYFGAQIESGRILSIRRNVARGNETWCLSLSG